MIGVFPNGFQVPVKCVIWPLELYIHIITVMYIQYTSYEGTTWRYYSSKEKSDLHLTSKSQVKV